MCTAVILANDTTPRFEGPTKIGSFAPPNNFAPPRTALPTNARYQTLPPYRPFMENETSPRGVDALSDDRGNIIHICPFCDTDQPKPLKDRKALLLHLRGQHLGETRVIAPEVLKLFGIERCTECELHYSAVSIKTHHCRPGAVTRVVAAVTQQNKAVPLPVITAFLMTHPNQISDELVDRLTAISYDEIFAHQARTISEIHHSSVRMW